MDKPRQNPKRKKGPIYIAGAIVGAVVITLGLSQLKPAPPSVEGAALWLDTVQHGQLIRQVTGPGTLVPEQIRIIPAVTAGRVEEVYLRPGAQVEPGTRLLRLTNPDVELNLLESERQLTQARTQLVNLTVLLQTNQLVQEGAVAQTRTQFAAAERTWRNNQELYEKNLITRTDYETSQEQYEELQARLALEQQQLDLMKSTVDEQLGAQRLDVQRLEQIVAFQRTQLESMNVVAGTQGVLQMLDLEVGQYVQSGFELARVVQPGRLKAEVRIPETQAAEVLIGQTAHVDTRNGIVTGRVVRIDPAAQQATVGVDIELPDSLPPGARPDLQVDARIEINRLDDVLFVGRPQYGNANSSTTLFKLEPGGREATRVTVRFGQSSVNEIVVLQGLQEGDVVILSEMSQQESYDRIRLR